MAWTTPPAWVATTIVTALQMNTNIRDNLRYLKGQAGTVAIEDAMTVAGNMAATGVVSGSSGSFSGTGGTLLAVAGSATSTTISVSSPNVASQNAIVQLANSGQRVGQIIMDRANDKLRIATNTGTTPAISIDPSGNVGIGAIITPQGALHGYNTIGGFTHYEFDGVDGTARTVIPNATGDVLYAVGGVHIVRHSAGGTAAGLVSSLGDGTAAVVPGANQNLYNSGGNTLQLQVNANGAITVQRTAGTGTYKVALWLIWM